MLKRVPKTKIFYCQFDGKNVEEIQMLVTAVCSERKIMSVDVKKTNDGLVINDFRLSFTDHNNQKLKPGDYFVQEGKYWRIIPKEDFRADENVVGNKAFERPEVNWI